MTARRPSLALVREGNPGHRSKERLEGGVKVPPGAPPEPDWSTYFSPRLVKVPRKRKSETVEDAIAREQLAEERDRELTRSKWAREEAHRVWDWAISVLDPVGLVAKSDQEALVDLVLCVVRLKQAERDISTHGMLVQGERGWVRNPAVTSASGYRKSFQTYCAQFGLTPLARDRMRNPEAGDDEDSPFDV